jgi:uncharacterized protein (DUF305 family)
MTKMMIDMGISRPAMSTLVFVAMMAPHHQGAIEMAQAELRHGRNEPVRRMAQEIIGAVSAPALLKQRDALEAVFSGSAQQPVVNYA